MSNRGWTPERRARQAQLIRQWQPWRQSTGPRTVAGKQRASRNACKGGMYAAIRAELRQLRVLLREQEELRKRLQ